MGPRIELYHRAACTLVKWVPQRIEWVHMYLITVLKRLFSWGTTIYL